MLIAIFAVQMLFFWCAVQIFWCAGKNIFERAVQTFAASLPPFSVSFCYLMTQVLPPYGASFAALWHEFSRLNLKLN
jgi:hypothetical protein